MTMTMTMMIIRKRPFISYYIIVLGLPSFGGLALQGFMGLRGNQDTLWDSTGRHYRKSRLIEGAIDFMWGTNASHYEVNYPTLILISTYIPNIQKSIKTSVHVIYFSFYICNCYNAGMFR